MEKIKHRTEIKFFINPKISKVMETHTEMVHESGKSAAAETMVCK